MAKATDTTLKPGMVNLSTPAVAQNRRQGVVPNMTPIPPGMREAILAKGATPPAPAAAPQIKPAPTAPLATAPAAVTQPAPITGQAQTPSGAIVDARTGGLVTPPPQLPEQKRGLFSDIVSSLAERQRYVSPMVEQPYGRAQELTEQLRQSRINEARAIGSQALAPIPIGDITGRQQAIRQLYETQQQALAQELAGQAQLAQIGQATTAEQRAALQAAAGVAAPSAQFPFVFDPVTGQFFDTSGGAGGAGGGLNPLTQIDQIADQVVSGQRAPSQAEALGGNIPNWRSLLNERIQAKRPGFDFASAEGQFAARQQATQIAGAAPTQTAAGLYETASKQFQDLRGQVRNVDSLGELLLDVAGAGVINPVDLTIGNKTIAQVRRNLSAAEQVRFDSALATFSSAASQLLASQSGQIPTAISENIAKIANGQLSLPALTAMVQQAKREGDIKLATAASQVNAPASVLGAPQVQVPKVDTSRTPSTPQVTPRGLQYKII